jgi:hypothetical protein
VAAALRGPALWNGTRHIDRASLPSHAVMLLDHVSGLTREENDRQSQVMAERGLTTVRLSFEVTTARH